jgi:hypothetical protein
MIWPRPMVIPALPNWVGHAGADSKPSLVCGSFMTSHAKMAGSSLAGKGSRTGGTVRPQGSRDVRAKPAVPPHVVCKMRCRNAALRQCGSLPVHGGRERVPVEDDGLDEAAWVGQGA